MTIKSEKGSSLLLTFVKPFFNLCNLPFQSPMARARGRSLDLCSVMSYIFPQMQNRRFLPILLILLLHATPVLGLHTFQLHINEEKLTLHANQVPLQDVLKRLVAKGISVQIDPEINPLVSADMDELDMATALKSLLKSTNYALDWKTKQRGDATEFILTGIQVFRPAKKDLMQPLAANGNQLHIASDQRDGSLYVINQLLIRLKPGLTENDLQKILARYPVTIEKLGTGAGVYRITFTEDTDILALVDALNTLPGVAKAEPNYAYPAIRPHVSSRPPTGPPLLVTTDKTMAGATVAILDSGLAGNPNLDNLVKASLDALNPQGTIADNQGHGTQMAYIASGRIRPHGRDGNSALISVVPIRVFDDNGFTSNSLIMESLNFAQQNGARVINMSWGSEQNSDLLEETFAQVKAAGLVLVAAAGNEPIGRPVYPAAYSSVIGVGALEPHGSKWPASNYGEFVTVYAPGYATLPIGYQGEPGLYAGTSIASALVAHEVARLLAIKPDATFEEIATILAK